MHDDPEPAQERRVFRRTVAKVFAVQLLTLLALWLLQARFHP